MPPHSQPSVDPAGQARRVVRLLAKQYPEAQCTLTHHDPFQLIVATILSAQCTDARVNLVTPALFARYPDPRSLAEGKLPDVESLIRSTGFFRSKAKNLVAMAHRVVEQHGGEIPDDLESLKDLPGVGRKTANVVLGAAFGTATGVVVDTHVKRLAYRLGLTKSRNPAVIERDLMSVVPRKQWIDLSHRLIQHGRQVCLARRPRCADCALAAICPKNGVHSSQGE